MLFENLSEAMLPYLEEYESCVGVAGIRYGSVAYIAFGDGVTMPHKRHLPTTNYPVEMEFGADYWEIIQGGKVVMDSNFSNVEAARNKIKSLLVGQKLQKIVTEGSESRLEFECDIMLKSLVAQEPASGFLYSFHVASGPTWETIDGVSTA